MFLRLTDGTNERGVGKVMVLEVLLVMERGGALGEKIGVVHNSCPQRGVDSPGGMTAAAWAVPAVMISASGVVCVNGCSAAARDAAAIASPPSSTKLSAP